MALRGWRGMGYALGSQAVHVIAPDSAAATLREGLLAASVMRHCRAAVCPVLTRSPWSGRHGAS
jgi:hypothetical protein